MKPSHKDENGALPDPRIAEAINRRIKDETLPCALAFDIAATLGVEASQVGSTADLMEISLSKCQLGLFGYSPVKKIVAPRLPENGSVTEAIREGLVENRLPCVTAWKIAADFGISKLALAGACEAAGVKIKPCQLGAF